MLFGAVSGSLAQEESTLFDENERVEGKWDLEQCIDYAFENNFNLKQNKLLIDLNEVNHLQSKLNLLPSVNAVATHGYNWGQTIDLFTNQFADQRVRNNNFFAFSSFTIFQGFQRMNTIRQNKYEVLQSREQVKRLKNDLAIQIANNFLNVLVSQELVRIAEEQVEFTEQQVVQTTQFVEAGTQARNVLADLEAQLEDERLMLQERKNELNLAEVGLIQLLQLDEDMMKDFAITAEGIDAIEIAPLSQSMESIYKEALEILPEMKAAEYNILKSERGLAAARGRRSPQLDVTGAYGAGYSGMNFELDGSPQITGFDTIGTVQGDPSDPVLIPDFEFDLKTKAFWDQLEDNINRNLSFNLNVPIFNGLQTHSAIKRAKIEKQRAEIELEQAKNQVLQSVQTSYANLLAAQKKYEAAKKSEFASKKTFDLAQVQLEVGTINTVEFLRIKNRYIRAESEKIQSKYDYIFKRTILDFYRGNSLAIK